MKKKLILALFCTTVFILSSCSSGGNVYTVFQHAKDQISEVDKLNNKNTSNPKVPLFRKFKANTSNKINLLDTYPEIENFVSRSIQTKDTVMNYIKSLNQTVESFGGGSEGDFHERQKLNYDKNSDTVTIDYGHKFDDNHGENGSNLSVSYDGNNRLNIKMSEITKFSDDYVLPETPTKRLDFSYNEYLEDKYFISVNNSGEINYYSLEKEGIVSYAASRETKSDGTTFGNYIGITNGCSILKECDSYNLYDRGGHKLNLFKDNEYYMSIGNIDYFEISYMQNENLQYLVGIPSYQFENAPEMHSVMIQEGSSYIYSSIASNVVYCLFDETFEDPVEAFKKAQTTFNNAGYNLKNNILSVVEDKYSYLCDVGSSVNYSGYELNDFNSEMVESILTKVNQNIVNELFLEEAVDFRKQKESNEKYELFDASINGSASIVDNNITLNNLSGSFAGSKSLLSNGQNYAMALVLVGNGKAFLVDKDSKTYNGESLSFEINTKTYRFNTNGLMGGTYNLMAYIGLEKNNDVSRLTNLYQIMDGNNALQIVVK